MVVSVDSPAGVGVGASLRTGDRGGWRIIIEGGMGTWAAKPAP